MPDYFVSFDLRVIDPDPYTEFIGQAETRGWVAFKWEPNKKKWYRLPLTTLVGKFSNRRVAMERFASAREAAEAALGAKVTVQKFILAAYTNTNAVFDSNERLEPQE